MPATQTAATQINILFNGQVVVATFLNMQDCCGVQMVSYQEVGKPTRYGVLELDEDGKRTPIRSTNDLWALRKLGVVATLQGHPAR